MGLESSHFDQKYLFASFILWMGMFILPLLAYFDFQYGFLYAATAKLVVAVSCPLSLYLAKRLQWQRGLTLVASYSLFFMTLFGAVTKMGSIYGLIWIPILPLLFIYTGGRRLGLLQTLIYLLVMSLSFFYLHQDAFGQDAVVVYLQTLLAYSIVTVVAFIYEHTQLKMRSGLQLQADLDFLTGSMNRRGLVRGIEAEMDACVRHGTRFSLILLDLDDFKRINDRRGHDVGDLVLQGVVRLMRQQLRKNDLLGRWGGEEFILILPHTRLSEAAIMAERLRSSLAQQVFSRDVVVTASFGVTEYRSGEALNDLIQRVDQTQYQAKRSKNCVVVDEAEA